MNAFLFQNLTTLIFPWIVITVLEMVSFFIVVLFRVVHPRRYYTIHVPKLIFAILCHILVIYMIQCVYSCYYFLKQDKKRPKMGGNSSIGEFQNSVF